MEKHIVTIRSISHITHDTLLIITDKPTNYIFKPGQATDIAINKNGWQKERRPFTFTSLPNDPYLEFIIKTYPEHDGATDKLLDVSKGDELILHEVFGKLTYQGEGLFVAGGAGITPFLSMFRQLDKEGGTGNNTLIFANKTRKDIIAKQELEALLKGRVHHILSDEEADGFDHGMITKDYLKSFVEGRFQKVYICGPPPMMEAVEKLVQEIGLPSEQIITEAW